MRHHDVAKAMGGGLLGTLLQTLMVYGVVPLLAGQSITVAVLREHACAPGLLAHLLSGGVLFPLWYLWLASHAFSGPTCCRACSGRGSSGAAPKSSWRCCWARRSSVRRSGACRPRCGHWQGTWPMAPRSAASPGPQRLRPGRPSAPGEAARGRQPRVALADDRSLPVRSRLVRADRPGRHTLPTQAWVGQRGDRERACDWGELRRRLEVDSRACKQALAE